MATEKRLISLDEALEATHKEVFWTESEAAAVRSFLLKRPKVDAVEVDKFNVRLHHIIIDNEGVPEVKLQIGDRYFNLRTDPVDVREVVHGLWEVIEASDELYQCSACGEWQFIPEEHFAYCPNCGAKMDGDGDG